MVSHRGEEEEEEEELNTEPPLVNHQEARALEIERLSAAPVVNLSCNDRPPLLVPV